jgi:hypothetical protein
MIARESPSTRLKSPRRRRSRHIETSLSQIPRALADIFGLRVHARKKRQDIRHVAGQCLRGFS